MHTSLFNLQLNPWQNALLFAAVMLSSEISAEDKSRIAQWWNDDVKHAKGAEKHG